MLLQNMRKISTLQPKSSDQIIASPLGIGFETLDRDCFDPERCYDIVAASGVKWIRIQSGWTKTEKERGIYDFTWLDSIVDNLLSRGLIPWLDIGYGNKLYTPECDHPTGVGFAPVYSEEARQGWKNYITALISQYQTRLTYYEIWNEPDGGYYWKPNGPNGHELGAFTAETARIIRSVQPEAVIFGGVLAGGFRVRGLEFLEKALEAGMGKEIDYVTYHRYTPVPEDGSGTCTRAAQALLAMESRPIGIIQGETGAPSRDDGFGAMSQMAWTEEKQARYLLRQMVADVGSGVYFTSYFTTVDIPDYPGRNGGAPYAYFGVLHGDDYTPKASYYALQNLCAILDESAQLTELPVLLHTLANADAKGRQSGDDPAVVAYRQYGFSKTNGSAAFFYWNPVPLLTSQYEGSVSLWVARLSANCRLIDPLTGIIYEIPEKCFSQKSDSQYVLEYMPLLDYPLLITFGDFLK
jgi:hypothetical protein